MIPRVMFLTLFIIAGFSTSANAEIHPDSTATIAAILEDADCPLTDVQADTLATLVMGLGFGDIYHSLYMTLSDDQKATLLDTLGPWQGTPEWRSAPRWIHWVIIFDNYGQPLKKSQIDRLKAQPTGSPEDSVRPVETTESIEDILTADQFTLLLQMYENRGDN